MIKVKAPFIDKISGLPIVKILDGGTHSTVLIRLKFMHETWGVLDIVKKDMEIIIFKPEEMIRIVDLRALGYFTIKQGILQQNLSRYYTFK